MNLFIFIVTIQYKFNMELTVKDSNIIDMYIDSIGDNSCCTNNIYYRKNNKRELYLLNKIVHSDLKNGYFVLENGNIYASYNSYGSIMFCLIYDINFKIKNIIEGYILDYNGNIYTFDINDSCSWCKQEKNIGKVLYLLQLEETKYIITKDKIYYEKITMDNDNFEKSLSEVNHDFAKELNIENADIHSVKIYKNSLLISILIDNVIFVYMVDSESYKYLYNYDSGITTYYINENSYYIIDNNFKLCNMQNKQITTIINEKIIFHKQTISGKSVYIFTGDYVELYYKGEFISRYYIDTANIRKIVVDNLLYILMNNGDIYIENNCNIEDFFGIPKSNELLYRFTGNVDFIKNKFKLFSGSKNSYKR